MNFNRIVWGLGVFCAAQAAWGFDAPRQVHWGVNKVYAPVGFDDNDRVQVVVEGSFNSTCLKVGAHQLSKDEKNKRLLVDQSAYLYQGICLPLQVPFTQVVDAGLLSAGDWTVVDANNGKKLGAVHVDLSNNAGPDDVLYASLSDAYVRQGATGGKQLCLNVTYTDRCTELKEVDIKYEGEVIIVRPIAEHAMPSAQNQDCAGQDHRFQRCEALPDGLIGTFLLHVRSMNGLAINKVVDLR